MATSSSWRYGAARDAQEEVRSREAKRRAQAEQERERRDREAEELERAAAVRQSAAIEVSREAEELAGS